VARRIGQKQMGFDAKNIDITDKSAEILILSNRRLLEYGFDTGVDRKIAGGGAASPP